MPGFKIHDVTTELRNEEFSLFHGNRFTLRFAQSHVGFLIFYSVRSR